MSELLRLINNGTIDLDFILDDSDVRSVYLIRSGKFYKIGYAKHVQRRLASIRCGSARPVELVLTIETDDYVALEAAFHALFRAKRHRGEWFALDSADVRILRSCSDLASLYAQVDVNDPRIVQAQTLQQSGASGKQIAQHLHVSSSTVSRWLRRTPTHVLSQSNASSGL